MKIVDEHNHCKTEKSFAEYEKQLKCEKYLIVRYPDFGLDDKQFFNLVNAKENRLCLDCCFMDKNIDEEIKRLEQNIKEQPKIVGIKIMLEDGLWTDPRSEECKKVYALAKKYELTVTFHCGHREFAQPSIIEIVAKQFPKLNFVICHMGGHYELAETFRIVSENKNTYANISGLFCDMFYIAKLVGKEIKNEDYVKFIPMLKNKFNTLFEKFPAAKDKIMFGTDYVTGSKVLNQNKIYVDLVKQFKDKDTQTKIFWDNFFKAYPKANKL